MMLQSTGARAVGQALLAVYFFVGIEWLFYATKSSFLNALSYGEQLLVLAVSPLPLLALALASVAVATALGAFLPRARAWLLATVPAVFATGGAILMIDNFTYITLGFGVIVVRNPARLFYGLLFAVLFAAVLRALTRELRDSKRSVLPVPMVGALVLSLACALGALAARNPVADILRAAGTGDQPDVFLISGDGLEVARLERYGNPVIEMSDFAELGPTAVAFDNAFTNSNSTTVSTSMVLTGKYALTTSRLGHAEYFEGLDAYEHLPALLRERGYRSLQVGGTDIVDAQYWGMRRGFDRINDRRIAGSPLTLLGASLGDRLAWEFYFTDIVLGKLAQRIRHGFLGRMIEERHLIVERRHEREDEDALVEIVEAFVQSSNAPLFVQFHSIAPRVPDWGLMRETGSPEWFRADVARIIQLLKGQDRFENSIIVVWSDHGWNYRVNHRLPLVIKPPRGVEMTATRANVQNIDIPPTVLALLGMPIPAWMEGRSLLSPIDPMAPIWSAVAKERDLGLSLDRPDTPVLAGLRDVGLIVCDHWYRLKTMSNEIRYGRIRGHTKRCPPEELPSPGEARDRITQRLREYGYGPALAAMEERKPDQ